MRAPRGPRAVAAAVAAVLLAGSAAGAVVLVGGADDDGETVSLALSTPSASSTPTPTPTTSPSESPSPTSPAATSAAPPPTSSSPSPTATDDGRLDADDRLTTTGVGPLQLDMTYEEVERVTGYEVEVIDWLDTGGKCVHVNLSGVPAGERVHIYGSDGTVRGFVLDEESVRATRSGVRIGDTEQRVREVYGDRLEEQEYPIREAGKRWLYVEPEGSGHQLVLWLKDGRVFTMSSGYRGWAMMYEGCA